MRPTIEYKLTKNKTVVFCPGKPQRLINTIDGDMVYSEWCKMQADEINRQSPKRAAAAYREKNGEIGVKARCYVVINANKK